MSGVSVMFLFLQKPCWSGRTCSSCWIFFKISRKSENRRPKKNRGWCFSWILKKWPCDLDGFLLHISHFQTDPYSFDTIIIALRVVSYVYLLYIYIYIWLKKLIKWYVWPKVAGVISSHGHNWFNRAMVIYLLRQLPSDFKWFPRNPKWHR